MSLEERLRALVASLRERADEAYAQSRTYRASRYETEAAVAFMTYGGSSTKDAECVWCSPGCERPTMERQVEVFGR